MLVGSGDWDRLLAMAQAALTHSSRLDEMDRPETRYIDSSGTAIAFQEFGLGSEPLLVVGALLDHIETMWEVPVMARHMRQLGSFARVVFFDRRGVGQSDRAAPDAPSTIADHVGDIAAIIEALGGEPVNIFATAEGCAPALVFAAEYPGLEAQQVLDITTAVQEPLTDAASFCSGRAWREDQATSGSGVAFH